MRGHPRVVVLAYHSVHPVPAVGSTTPEAFRVQIAWLRRHCRIIALDRALPEVRAGDGDRPAVAVTFDDGLAGLHEFALPVLREFEIPATLFVTTGLVDGDDRVLRRYVRVSGWPAEIARPLAWRQVTEMAECGVELGAHTVTHPNLAIVARETAEIEIGRSRRDLEERFGTPVRKLAYPFGKPGHHFTGATMDIVRESGFELACAIHHRGLVPSDDPFAIPRFAIANEDEPSFAAKILGSDDGTGLWQDTAPRWLSGALSPMNAHRRIGSLLTETERSTPRCEAAVEGGSRSSIGDGNR